MNTLIDKNVLSPPNKVETEGFMALLIVQLMGVLLAGGLTFSLSAVYGETFSANWIFYSRVVVSCILLLTMVIASFQTEFLSLFWSWFDFRPPAPKGVFGVKQALCIYFLADFAALAVLIYGTGGSEQSLYSTFLFVLVPITIALGRKPGTEIVIGFAFLTIAIFLVLLWVHSTLDSNGGASDGSRRIWFGVITTMCVVFPTIVYWGQNREVPSATSVGTLMNTKRLVDPSGAEPHTLRVQDGTLERASAIGGHGGQ